MRLLFSFAIMLVSLAGIAQQPKKQTAIIKIPGAQCELCKKNIEGDVPKYVDGLISIVVNFRNHTAKVQWYPDRTNIEELKTAIANAGYDADDVTAEPDRYKRLPKTCKRPEDGGTHAVAKKEE